VVDGLQPSRKDSHSVALPITTVSDSEAELLARTEQACKRLKDQIARLPQQPGVYLWRNAAGDRYRPHK